MPTKRPAAGRRVKTQPRAKKTFESRYRTAADYVTADFVSIVGDGPPAGFIANEIDAFGPRLPCPGCHREGRSRDRALVASLCIDEDLLARTYATRTDLRPDVFNLSNGGFVVSRRFADQLAAYGAKGFSLGEVLRTDTHRPSEQYFLLVATTAVVSLCPVHTPTIHEPCPDCGEGFGTRLGDFHVEAPLVRGLDVFSSDRHGLADLWLSRGLFQHLAAANTVGLLASFALDLCQHEPTPERSGAATPVTMPARGPRPPRARCSIESFLRFVRTPGATVECTRAGESGTRRTFAVENMIEPGADPRELDALERRFGDVAHLRPLALQADGILLFHQAGCRPSMFPTRAAFQETEGEVDVPAALRFEKACDWPVISQEMIDQFDMLDEPFLGAGGVPFVSVVGSSDVLVCAGGRIYYFSPLGNGYHNQVIANDLPELLGLLTTDLAVFLRDTASVTRYYDAKGAQWCPVEYRVCG